MIYCAKIGLAICNSHHNLIAMILRHQDWNKRTVLYRNYYTQDRPTKSWNSLYELSWFFFWYNSGNKIWTNDFIQTTQNPHKSQLRLIFIEIYIDVIELVSIWSFLYN